MAKRKPVRVPLHLDRHLRSQGFSLSERVAAIKKAKSETPRKLDGAAVVSLAYSIRHHRKEA